MAEGPVAKKIRIWNPAVSEQHHQETSTSELKGAEVIDEKPLDCSSSKMTQLQIPNFFQNYLQLAPLMMRMHQQRHIEEMARRQFFTHLAQQPRGILPIPPPPQPSQPPIPIQLPSVSQSPITVASITPPPPSTIPPMPIANPIVATALGSPLINENCCAVCGAAFRLTGDLVQHMRNNHRKSKFKRKSDLRH